MPRDRERLIEDAKARVEALLEARLPEKPEEGMTLDEIEAVVESTLREVAAWLEERLIQEQQPEKTNRAACPQCGASCRFKRLLDTSILTIHGARTIPRRYHYCAACGQGFAPIDAALGLEPGRDATRQVRAWQALFGSESVFASVPELFRELRGIEVSASTVERTTVEVGQRLRVAAPQAAPSPPASDRKQAPAGKKAPSPEPAERLYLSMDGTMCPLRDAWKRDGSQGKLVCRYGEAKLGIAFQTRQKEGLDTEVVRRGCVGTLGDLGVFLPLVLALGKQWRLHAARELIVLGDGAVWLWLLVGTHFAQAVQILDFWHLTEHLWTVARAMHGSGTEAAQAWVKQAQWDLKHDLIHSFLVGVRQWRPESEEGREVRRVELAFFEANQARMKYGTFLAKGYMIGSGVMESGCRQLAGQRLDQAGMHWREETADAVLAIRAHQRSTGAPPLTRYA
jgi:hypothetical protein